MSYHDTKQALITKLINSKAVPKTSIAYENESFNPTGKAIWLSAHFIPATSDMMGKNSASGTEQRGIFQISVYVRKNADNFDNDQLIKIDLILKTFKYNTRVSSNGQQVDILDSTVTPGLETESWFKRDISINYLTFSTR